MLYKYISVLIITLTIQITNRPTELQTVTVKTQTGERMLYKYISAIFIIQHDLNNEVAN